MAESVGALSTDAPDSVSVENLSVKEKSLINKLNRKQSKKTDDCVDSHSKGKDCKGTSKASGSNLLDKKRCHLSSAL